MIRHLFQKLSGEASARDAVDDTPAVSRRGFLRAGVGGTGLLGAAALGLARVSGADSAPSNGPRGGAHTNTHAGTHAGMHPMPAVVGEVDHAGNGFDPTQTLTDFDGGTVSTLPSGQTLREYTIFAQNKTIEVVPGVTFAAWTFNGRVPGPTIRVREGDRVRVTHHNASDHPHSLHFHGVHPGSMDGVFDVRSGMVPPGGRHTYEFDAEPFG